MLRTNIAILAGILIVGLAFASAPRADDITIKLGENYEGEIGGNRKPTPGVNVLGEINPAHAAGNGFQDEVTVKLKAGQKVLISAKVKGNNRKVHVILRDRTGAPVAASKIEVAASAVKTEVAVTDKHTINIVSDRIGAYTLIVTTDDELSEDDLLKKIEELEKHLKELKAKLKEKQDKKP